MNELFTLSAFDLAKKIRMKEISPVEVVECFIQEIERVNPKINAVVQKTFESARVDAKKAVELLQSQPDEVPPLLGVPFTCKEMIHVKGVICTNGSQFESQYVAQEDATVIKRLKKAGAILVGVTNVPEWGMWVETNNKIYGRTNNPFDLKRTPGGSSGGEGAIIATGATAFGLGSDAGGSVRIPAFYCGIFGHKPTNGLVPMTGHHPVFRKNSERFVQSHHPHITIGPMTKHASDLYPLMQILAGPDGIDDGIQEIKLTDKKDVDWKKVKVYLMPNPKISFASKTKKELQETVYRAGDVFIDKGARVVEADSNLLKEAFRIWTAVFSEASHHTLNETVFSGQSGDLFNEALLMLRKNANISFSSLLFCVGEKLGVVSYQSEKLIKEAKRLQKKLEASFSGNGILILPTLPNVAPKHSTSLLTPFDFAMASIFNALQFPVTAVPMGLGVQKLPLGVQIASSRFNDFLTIEAARLLEEAYGGWSPAQL